MNNLIILNENIINGYNEKILSFFYIFMIFSGLLTITAKNPIISVLFLIGLFSSVSCYLITIGLNFIGLSYLIVYVGAVSILFLFILMLINIRISELKNDTHNTLPLIIIILILFYTSLFKLLPYNTIILNDKYDLSFNINSNNINFVISKLWDGNIIEINHIESIGNIIYSSYSMWLIISSLILLLAMVGTIVITIKQKD